MAKASYIQKKIQMDLFEMVKFQIVIHCFLEKIHLNETELNCLALLGTQGEIRLVEFCRLATDMGFLSTPTAVNNCLSRVEKSKLFIKKGAGKKIIFLNPDVGFETKGNIVFDLKFFRLDTEEAERDNKVNSGTAAAT